MINRLQKNCIIILGNILCYIYSPLVIFIENDANLEPFL